VILIWCLVPRAYYTGTDSVNALTVSTPITVGTSACVGGLNIPAGTVRIQFATVSGQATAPELQLTLRTAKRSYVSPVTAAPAEIGVIKRVSFPVPRLTARSASVPGALCLRAVAGTFAVAGTPTTEALQPPLQIGGRATLLRLAVWYLPRAGATRSYLDELSTMFDRAALFAPGFVRPWLFALIFLLVLPAASLLAIRCLAVGAAGGSRKLALGLYAIAVLNGAAWSLITPAFQGPDEVDHFAYVQSLAERGEKPSPYAASSAKRWSTAEEDLLLGTDMLTDHQVSDSRAPELPADVAAYRQLASKDHPVADDGGGLQTTSSYGPLYYLALTPGYLLASRESVLSQLEVARLVSVLIGALACVFSYLTVREIAPRQVWLAVLAGLLVAFQPMYSFLSGTVNNDIGIDAGAAAVAYLLIRIIRRGFERRIMGVLGLLLGALPFVKDSAYELYPLALLAVGGALWRHRGRLGEAKIRTIVSLAVLGGSLALSYVLASVLDGRLSSAAPFPGAPRSETTASGSLSVPLHHPLSYLAYLWEVFLPRLPGMTPHFPPSGLPATTIFTRRGWAAFGWYDVFFPGWVYHVLAAVMLGALALGLIAIWREHRFVAARRIEAVILVLFPVVIVASFEAVFYTMGTRTVIAEMGRYVFPALVPLAALAVGALFAFGRRSVLAAGTTLLMLALAFCYASQLLMFTAFYS
jgi:Predicted membrane protein (DUF2142)